MGSPEISTVKTQLLAKNSMSKKIWEWEELTPIQSLGTSGSPVTMNVALLLDMDMNGSGENKNTMYNLSGPLGTDRRVYVASVGSPSMAAAAFGTRPGDSW